MQDLPVLRTRLQRDREKCLPVSFRIGADLGNVITISSVDVRLTGFSQWRYICPRGIAFACTVLTALTHALLNLVS